MASVTAVKPDRCVARVKKIAADRKEHIRKQQGE
jgi:hypothetical protein